MLTPSDVGLVVARSDFLGIMTKRIIGSAVSILLAVNLVGCAGAPELSPARRPLSKDAMMLLGKKGLKPEAPMFVRIFKEESELEVWKQRDDGNYHHFKTYPICTWSGELGPKLAQGDRQAPEGFYTIQKPQMNPNSSFHLAFNLGFPNNYDRAHGRTGSALMVHGKCKSAGCYAMTDALIEEIYALARETFEAGNESFQVHAYPFRMTEANMARHKGSQWTEFWKTLKEGHDHFEATRQPPSITICSRRYHVNARPIQTVSTRIDPGGACPQLERLPITPYVAGKDQQQADARIVAPGPKMRALASNEAPSTQPSAVGLGSLLPGQSNDTRHPTASGGVGFGFSPARN